MRVGRAVNLYRAARRAEWRINTRRQTGYVLDAFARYVGDDRALKTLRREHVERWLARFDTPSYAGRCFSVVRGFTAWCVQNRYLTRDPCTGLRGPRRPRTSPRELRGDEVRTLLAAAPDSRLAVILSLAFHEGLRRGEIAGLEVGDIDRLGMQLRVVGKGGHERFIPLSGETHDAIGRYLGEYPAIAGPLVRSYTTNRAIAPNTITILVTKLMFETGIKERAWDGKSAHAGRHTAAGTMIDQGADLRIVQNFLGHANLTTINVYTKRRHTADQIRPFLPNYSGIQA